MSLVEIWFDGCCEPVNPGGYAGWGAALFVDGTRVWENSVLVGHGKDMSNNVAEYSGCLAAMEEAIRRGFNKGKHKIVIRGDSKLVINQLPLLWKRNGGLYYPFFQKAREAYTKLGGKDYVPKGRVTLEWIPREENSIADELSKRALKEAGVKFRIQPE